MAYTARLAKRISRLKWTSASVLILAAAGCSRDDAADPTAPDLTPDAPSLATAPTAATIDLTLHRLTSGSGTVLVSSGIPLARGALRADQLGYVRVYAGGKEQAIYVEALKGTHPDGSLRAILVQFKYSLAKGTPVPGQLKLGSQRTIAGIAKTAVTWDVPAAIAVPSSSAYLVGTGLFGPTLPQSASPTSPSFFAKYESDFARYSDSHWITDGAAYDKANYYDRARSHYAFWARTGTLKYWERATALAADYRRRALEPANYQVAPHAAMLDGVELHYFLTGQEKSRTAVVRVADRFAYAYDAKLGDRKSSWLEGRVQGRVLNAYLLAWRVGDQTRAWPTLMRNAVGKILSTQSSDGAYRFPVWCGHHSNYMTGIANDALIRVYDEFEPDSRIPPAIKKSLDYMWSTQWLSSARVFKYLSGSCSGKGGTGPGYDLSMLIVNGFGWYARNGGGATYRDRGDQVFAGAVATSWLVGTKQFNQQYSQSYRYLKLR